MIHMVKRKACTACGNLQMDTLSWASLSNKPKNFVICDSCRSKLQPLVGACCSVCSRMLSELEEEYIQGSTCQDCFRWEQNQRWQGVLERNISLYAYNEYMKELIALFKYRGDYAIVEIFVSEIQRVVSELQCDYVIPIPLSKERLQERGFNQSEALIEAAGITSTQLLMRNHNEKQSKKSRKARMELKQIFMLISKIDLTNKQILIIDDIYTTGSTLRYAAEVLKKAGAGKIYSLTIAR